MRYFVSGHRDITEEEFNKHYVPLLVEILNSNRYASFVVGDCKGVDKMAMDFLSNAAKNGNIKLTIYHMFDSPRVTPSDIPIKYIDTIFNGSVKFKGGYTTDLERDTAMTNDSHVDVAWIRPGRNTSGTAQNIKRRYNL